MAGIRFAPRLLVKNGIDFANPTQSSIGWNLRVQVSMVTGWNMLQESDDSMVSFGTASFPHPSISGEIPMILPEFWAMQGIHRLTAQQAGNPPVTSSLDGIRHSSFLLNESQWNLLERGLKQRFAAVNVCMEEIVRLKRVPRFLDKERGWHARLKAYESALAGSIPQQGSWSWFASTDVFVRPNGEFMVFDHNHSLPTGFERLCKPPESLGDLLFPDIRSSRDPAAGIIFLLDPGPFAVTYRANEFLARMLDAKIGKASDLVVQPDGVYFRAGHLLVRVHTVVRRIDDDLLDPNVLRPDSLVGVPGLIRAWKTGLVKVVAPLGAAIANVRTFARMIPEMIRELLGEEPILPSAAVIECGNPRELGRVLCDVANFTIRTDDPLHPARPFFGRAARNVEFAALLERIRKNPEGYIARPLLPDGETSGFSLRVFASLGEHFRLLRTGLARQCQPDGGVPLVINSDAPLIVVQ